VLGRTSEVEQVVAFGIVQLQHPGHALEDGVRGASQVAAFHLDVVVDADTGEQRDLLPAQSGDPAVSAVGRPACSGVIRARREARNSRICARLSMPSR
jgi:hypothetical protein